MQTTVPLYGFGGGGGGVGAALTVIAPAGCTVTVSKDGKTKTKVADDAGTALFKGLEGGEWTVTITDGSQTAQKTVTVTADYATEMSFFAATINVTYPAGSVCTATDGVTTLTAPDTSGTWACVVPNAGTWTVTVTDGSKTDSKSVIIDTDGQIKDVLVGRDYLFKSGSGAIVEYVKAAYKTHTISMDNDAIVIAKGSGEGSAIWYTQQKIDVSRFKTLKMRARLTNDSSETSAWKTTFGIADGTNAFTSFDTYGNIYFAAKTGIWQSSDTMEIYTLDLSGVNGSFYIGFTSSAGVIVQDFWLEV